METNGQAAPSSSLEPWLELGDKVVMVTGASSGLGWNICLSLAKAGCKIIAAARRIDRLDTLCNRINTEFPISGSDNVSQYRAVALELDITATGTIIEARAEQAWNIFGRIDALVNNAGGPGPIYPPLQQPEEEWNNLIKLNQTGTWLVSKFVGIHMINAKLGGSIINITSITGLNRGVFHGGSAYTAAKTAADSITKFMALELGEFNIRVNSIAPAIFQSEITQDLVEKQWYKKVMEQLNPLRSDGKIAPGIISLNSKSIMYVIKGRARVQVVGNQGNRVFDKEVSQGQLLFVPQNFVVVKKASNEGFEWISFKTNDNAINRDLAGRLSAIRAMPVEVLMNSYGISREEARNLKYNREEGSLFSPISRSREERF